MEFKVIVYIIIGVLYFLYSIGKKAQENEKKAPAKPTKPATPNPNTPNPLDEILQEIKRKQAELEKQQKQPPKVPMPTQRHPKPQPIQKPKPKTAPVLKTGKDVLLHEKKTTVFEEGVTNAFSTFERELTPEEKIERGNLRIANEGVYKTESIVEMEAREKAEIESQSFDFDPRNAIISSIVLERKF